MSRFVVYLFRAAWWLPGRHLQTMGARFLRAGLDLPKEAGNFHLQRGGVGVSYDSRNNRFKPTDGWRGSLRHEIVGGIFGGNKDFSTTEFDLSGHFPVKQNDAGLRSVLQFRVRVSDAEGQGGGTVPVFERYFAGGTQSLRGFDRRTVGPVDITGAQCGSVEYIRRR